MKKKFRCLSCENVYDWPHLVRHQCIKKEKEKVEILDMSPNSILNFTKDWKEIKLE